jgi:fatty-acyl-CoA synthase
MEDIDRITIGTMLDRQAARYGDRECVVYTDRPLRLTYHQFRTEVDTIARGLMALDVRVREHVAIWASNVPEWLYLQYAIAKIGAVLVTVNTSYRARELEYVLGSSDTTTLFFVRSFKDIDYINTLREILPDIDSAKPGSASFKKLPQLRRLIFLGEERLPGMLKFSDLHERAMEVSPQQLAERAASLTANDVITIQYTSGTTGFAKGVMLTHRNVILNAYYMSGLYLTENDRFCFPVPLFHCTGYVFGSLGSITRGATMVPIDVFDPRAVLDAINIERCTVIGGVPTMLKAEIEHPDFRSFDLSCLRAGLTGGSPCPLDLVRAVRDSMGIELTIAYGVTESSGIITQTRSDDPIDKRMTTVGRALPGVEVKIAHPASGAPLPPGTPGELYSRGHGTMEGYYKDPEATAAAVDDERWLHSGDLAVMDEEGYVKIVGRIKDMIIRGGENVYAREVEDFLHGHPKILEVQVVGVPSKRWGEEVCAVVKIKPGDTLTADDVIAFCKGKIQRQKVPALVMFVDSYPVTATGKVQKYILRQNAIAQFGRQEDAAVETA